MKKLASNRMLAFFLACIMVVTTCLTVSISAVWDYDDPGTGMPDPNDPNEGLPYPEEYQSNPDLVPDENNAVVKYSFSYVPTVLDYEKKGTITTAKAGDVVWLNIAVKNINLNDAPYGLSAFEGHVTFDVEKLSLFCYGVDILGGDNAWLKHFTKITPSANMFRGVAPYIDWAPYWTPSKPAPDFQDDEIRGYGLHWGIAIDNVRRGEYAVTEDDSFVICMPIKLNDDLVEGEEYTFTIPYPRYEQLAATYVHSGNTTGVYARGGAYKITVVNHADVAENIATDATYVSVDGTGKFVENNGYLNDKKYPLTEKSNYEVFESGAEVSMDFSAPADIDSVTVTFNDTSSTDLPTEVTVYGIDSEGNHVLLGTDTTGVAYQEGIVDTQYYDNYFSDDENLTVNAANAYHYTISGFDRDTYVGIFIEAEGDKLAIGEIEVNGEYKKFEVTVENGTIENASESGKYDPNTVLTLKADEIDGKVFIGWTVEDDGTGSLADATAPETNFTVGTSDAKITANYEDKKYDLIVNNGSGSGQYCDGDEVEIVADNPPAGKYFSHWEVTRGDAVIDNPTASTATVTTSNGPSVITAVYSDNVVLTVINGEGSGQFIPGSDCNIIASVPQGYVFYKWELVSGNAVITNNKAASTVVKLNGSSTVKAHFIPLHQDVPDNLAPNADISFENGKVTMGNVAYLNDQLYPLTTSSKWALINATNNTIKIVYELDGLYTVDSLTFNFCNDSSIGLPNAIKIYGASAADAADRQLLADISGLTLADWTELSVAEYPEYRSNFYIYTANIAEPIPCRYVVVEYPSNASLVIGETEIYGELSRFVVDIGGGSISNASNDGTYLPGTELVLVPDNAPEGQVFAGWSYCGLGELDNANNTFVVGEGDAIISAIFVDIHKPVPDNLAPSSDFKVLAGTTSSNIGDLSGNGWYTGGYINDQLYPLTGGAKWVEFDTENNKVTVLAKLNGAYDISKVCFALGYDEVDLTKIPPVEIRVFGMNSEDDTEGVLIAKLFDAANKGFVKFEFDADVDLHTVAAHYELNVADLDIASYQYVRFEFNCAPMFDKRMSLGEIEIYGEKSQFQVNVENGTQTPETLDNLYYPGDVIEITANDIADKDFIGWTVENENGVIASTTDKTTTFTVGIGSNTITANYRDTLYHLNVVNGTGSGDYAKGTSVAISAESHVSSEMVFDKWVVTEGSAQITDATSADTTVITNGIATVEATYKERVYKLTVESGNGSGDYVTNHVVDISANEPPADMKFDHWEIVSGSGSFENERNASTRFTTTNEATTIRPVYVDILYNVTVQGGEIVNPDANGYVVGTEITLKPTVPEHKEFDHWEVVSGNGSFADASDENTKFTTGSGDTVINAVYKNAKYDLIVENGTGSGKYEYGTDADVSATIPDGYEFDKWVAEGDVVIADADSASTKVTVNGNGKVTATFTEKEYTVDVINGTVTDAKDTYKSGEVIDLVADEPEANKKFSGWVIVSGIGTFADASDANTKFTVGSENVVIRAEYEDILYTLTVENGTGSGEYAFDTIVDISATIPEGYVFVAWVTEDGAIVEIEDAASATTKVTVKGDTKVTATFEEKEYTVGVINGKVDADSLADTYKNGTVITIVADEAEDGKHFVGWEIVSGNATIADSNVATTTLTVGNSDVVVRANYADDLYNLTVENGTGEGIDADGIKEGTVITLTANQPPKGMVFDKWVVVSGDGEFADESNSNTTFKIGGADTVIKATYRETSTEETGDRGLALFGVLAAISAIGTAVVIKKKRS